MSLSFNQFSTPAAVKEEHTTTASAADGGADGISALPDDVIHQILTRSESPIKHAARLSLLSKRWNQIFLSYTILKFDDSCLQSKQPHERISAAESFKMFLRRRSSSTNSSTESVRIKIRSRIWDKEFLPGFLDDVLELTARVSPREIEVNLLPACPWYIIPRLFIENSNIRSLRRRLEVLKLKGCSFPDGISLGDFGISLKVIRLESVSFPSDGILDTMVACASRLETLKLYNICGVSRFQVTNHPNLKYVKVRGFKSGEFEIIGAHSLEKLRISSSNMSCFRVSSTPNLKVLDTKECTTVNHVKLISEIPSLESFVDGIVSIVRTSKLRQVKLQWFSSIVEIDDPDLTYFLSKLTKFITTLDMDHRYKKVAPLLVEFSQFRVTLRITSPSSKHILCDELPNALPTPAIEHLKFPSCNVNLQEDFLNAVLHTFHPKFISFTGEEDRISNIVFLVALLVMCKQLAERGYCKQCRGSRVCWHYQLKDVKMVTELVNGNTREDEIVDVSRDTFSSLVDGDRVSFMLTWD